MLTGSTILITGGTGSFGSMCARKLLEGAPGLGVPEKVIIFSRDELKQSELAAKPWAKDPRIRFFLGDVRDLRRLHWAFEGVDVVIHAAAMKQVPASEYNPFEAVSTNVIGAQNVIEAAIARGVSKVIALSTDKAVNPVNLYGATKLCAEKLFTAASAYATQRGPRFAVARYGNVAGSRGSVIPRFLAQLAAGEELTVTDPTMTRFWIDLPGAFDFVALALEAMEGGEIFVPKLPSAQVGDVILALAAPGAEPPRTRTIGIRPGEKLHETLIGEDEARRAVEADWHYVILPDLGDMTGTLKPGFSYRSDRNDHKLSVDELRALIGELA